jgi:hypothetical protein
VYEPNETAHFGAHKSPICCLVAVRKAARRLNATVPSERHIEDASEPIDALGAEINPRALQLDGERLGRHTPSSQCRNRRATNPMITRRQRDHARSLAPMIGRGHDSGITSGSRFKRICSLALNPLPSRVRSPIATSSFRSRPSVLGPHVA